MKTYYVADISFNLNDTVSIDHKIGVNKNKITKKNFEDSVKSFIEQSSSKSPWTFTSVDYVIIEKTYKKAPKNFVK